MEKESELQRLEKFVEKILVRFSALKAEKEQLEQDLFERELTIEELKGNISNKESERTEISSRVNKIVDQIEEWELNLEINAEASGKTDDEEQQEDVSDEDERRVQHELFSMAGSKE